MREEWGEALEVLDQILEEDEANSSARKRKIAIYKVGTYLIFHKDVMIRFL